MAANNVKLEKIFTDELEGFLSLIWFEWKWFIIYEFMNLKI
jgi:hypothetical protein